MAMVHIQKGREGGWLKKKRKKLSFLLPSFFTYKTSSPPKEKLNEQKIINLI